MSYQRWACQGEGDHSVSARPFANKRYTDSGAAHDDRGLKHRADKDMLARADFSGFGEDLARAHRAVRGGRQRQTVRHEQGRSYTSSAISGVWKSARK
ncbi:hypothetical protein AB0B89_35650 [Sphaerisporangium sp. NPDC049002]|uniref:hypothetical protein n=1 Tax=Sphaerisporangium sp. NPDC049002 TaxID=3155392 RepID=UPI0033ED1051